MFRKVDKTDYNLPQHLVPSHLDETRKHSLHIKKAGISYLIFVN